MAVTATVYDNFKSKKLNETNQINFASDTLKVLLCTSSYTPSLAHAFRSDLTNEVAAGGGYSTGGITLTTLTVTLDGTNHFGYFTADNITWSSATFTARYAVLYKDTGTSSTSPLVGYIDFGADQVNSGGNFAINWASNANGGILKLA